MSWIGELLIGNDSSFEGTLNGDMMREVIWDDVSMWIKLDLFRLSIATTEPRKEMIDPGCSVTVHIRRSCGLVPGRQGNQPMLSEQLHQAMLVRMGSALAFASLPFEGSSARPGRRSSSGAVEISCQ